MFCGLFQTGDKLHAVVYAAFLDLSRTAAFLEVALSYETHRHRVHGHSFKTDIATLLNGRLIGTLMCRLQGDLLNENHDLYAVSRSITTEHRNYEMLAYQDIYNYRAMRDLDDVLGLLFNVFTELYVYAENRSEEF